jgi:hypothetical protein
LGLRPLAALLLLPLACAWGQDERRVASPDGRLEFRIFIAQPERGELSRLAYRIFFCSKPLVETSYLGFNIHNQEPFLGEKVGLIGEEKSETAAVRCLIAHYMQDGSIGRLLDVEARVSNEAVAFRYRIPRSIALEELLVDDELTEFDLSSAAPAKEARLPYHAGEVWISEVARPPYPPVTLGPGDNGVLTTRLVRPYPDAVTAFEGKTPWVGPWRVVSLVDPARLSWISRL